jgi:hypothetical protein
MPPTYENSFVYKLPINNKWRVPKRVLERNGRDLVNRPEFDIDVSLIYHMQYTRDNIQVDKMFAENLDQGDYTPNEKFRIYSGAMDFQGKGGGLDGYSLLADLVPANHPVLYNSITLGVDPDKAFSDIQLARNMSKGAAASMWPTDNQVCVQM